MLHKICRLCLCKVENSRHLKRKNAPKSFEEIAKILFEIFHIQLTAFTKTKRKYKNICSNCEDQVIASYKFYCRIQASQRILDDGSIEALHKATEKLQEPVAPPSPFDDSIVDDLDGNDIKNEPENVKVPLEKKSDKKSTERIKTRRRRNIDETASDPAASPNKLQNDDDDRKISEFYSLKCSTCCVSFIKFIEYKNHMIEEHKISKPTIVCCDKNLRRRFRLLEHLVFHTDPEKFKCSDCGKQCLDPLSLGRHRRQYHLPVEERPHHCEKCPKKFASTSSLRAHLVTHLSKNEKNNLKTYVCEECGRGFMSKSKIDHHKRQRHLNLYACICDICAKTFQTKAAFLNHYKKEHGAEHQIKVQCSICSIWLSDEWSLKKHLHRIHTNTGPLKCNICEKVSPNEHALKSHQKWVHQKERKFQCTYCNKAFKLEITLREHTTTHLGGALYSCTFCDKTFNSNANMYSHRKKMHPVEVEKLREKKLNENSGNQVEKN